MTQMREVLSGDTYLDGDGDIKPYADVAAELDAHPVSDASIIQGMANLEAWRREQEVIDQGEIHLRHDREQALAAQALESADVYITLEEHRRNQLALADIISDLSMYRGGEKGGYDSKDFQQRYKEKASNVERGAKRNHHKRIHDDLPKIYKADELKTAGFDPIEVDFDAKTTMRSELMSRYGGPDNKKARDQWRKQYR